MTTPSIPPSPAHTAVYRPFGAFRFGLAMLVVLQHGLLLLPGAGREVFYDLELGAVAVTTFFALSGFIVAEALATFYAGRPGAFLANRALRVAPPYLAALALSVAVDAWLAGSGRLVALDAPLHGSPLAPRVVLGGVLEILPGFTARRVSGQDFSFIPFAWTLRVEMAFYLVAALASRLMAAGGQGRTWRRGVLGTCLAAAYGAFMVFAWRHGGTAGGGPLQVLCIPFFAFGLCLFLREPPGVAGVAHLVLVGGGVLLGFTFWGQRGHPVLAYQLPLLCALFATLAVLSRVRPHSRKLRRWDARLGALSYPLYLSHGVVLTLLAGLSTRRGALPYMLAIPLALVLAGVLHAVVEQPLRAVRTRLRGVVVG